MKSIAAILLLATWASCAPREPLFLLAQDKRGLRLQAERKKLTTQTDPVGRTKTQIKVADLLLTLIADAAMAEEEGAVGNLVDEYLAAIQDAHQTMMKTGRDAHRKPGGFKDLEIALRRQVRQLDDIGNSMGFEQRHPIEKAKTEASIIRDELLKALFGTNNAPNRKS